MSRYLITVDVSAAQTINGRRGRCAHARTLFEQAGFGLYPSESFTKFEAEGSDRALTVLLLQHDLSWITVHQLS